VRIPDYISPIVGWRVWQWDATGLRSLNNESWLPRKPLEAKCRVSDCGMLARRAEALRGSHDAPRADCSCGVYAAKNLTQLRTTGYARFGIHGEVFLWGALIEHERGFRAQFAYPKNLYLPLEMLPFTLAGIQSRLQTLFPYGGDIFIFHSSVSIPLWRKGSGLDAAGLDFLMGRGSEWYARRKQERTIKTGDRVAIIGRGIAVVEQVNDKQVQALLWNRSVLRVGRKEIVWDGVNMRWECEPSNNRGEQ